MSKPSRKRGAAPRRTRLCDHCGAEIAASARACRECGSDAETGWKDEEERFLASVELPEFDEDDYRAALGEIEGRGSGSQRLPRWVIVAAWILLVALVLFFVLGRL